MIWGHTGAEQTGSSIASAVARSSTKATATCSASTSPTTPAVEHPGRHRDHALAVVRQSRDQGRQPRTAANANPGQAWFSDFMTSSTRTRACVPTCSRSTGTAGTQVHAMRPRPGSRTISVGGEFAGGRPIWITEWGCLNESAPDEDTVVKFYQGALAVFARHPRVERYAWYPWASNCHLVDDNGDLDRARAGVCCGAGVSVTACNCAMAAATAGCASTRAVESALSAASLACRACGAWPPLEHGAPELPWTPSISALARARARPRGRACVTARARSSCPGRCRKRASLPRRVRSLVRPFSGGGSGTPARRAFDRPIAIACFVERAPCLPWRTWSISSCTNSPARRGCALAGAQIAPGLLNRVLFGHAKPPLPEVCTCRPNTRRARFSGSLMPRTAASTRIFELARGGREHRMARPAQQRIRDVLVRAGETHVFTAEAELERRVRAEQLPAGRLGTRDLGLGRPRCRRGRTSASRAAWPTRSRASAALRSGAARRSPRPTRRASRSRYCRKSAPAARRSARPSCSATNRFMQPRGSSTRQTAV